MENDYDDISQVRFRNNVQHDQDLQAANDRLIMKYFGSKMKTPHRPTQENHTEKFIKPKEWQYFKPIALTSVIVALMIVSKWPTLVTFLSFTHNEFVNQIIFYGIFFVLILLAIFVTYTPS